MKKTSFILWITLTAAALSAQVSPYDGYPGNTPLIQVALLLDTSNSMDGLINQAKSQLWKIVSHTARERRRGEQPRLEVGLYEYGNDGLSVLDGYIRQVVPFTSDLDYLSQVLFSLTTNGGSEYCGNVIAAATGELDWDNRPETLRLMFIAGNEPFNQGPVDFTRALRLSSRKDITVNTIFCGDAEEGRRTFWEEGAFLGGGAFMNINSDYVSRYIRSPQDDRLEELNRLLNETYLGYGSSGYEKKERQEAQDANAMMMDRGSFLERAKVKSSESYSNADWDLVDAYSESEEVLSQVMPAELPEEMRNMNNEEREAYLTEMQRKRAALQEEIGRLSTEREAYIIEQQALLQENDESTLDSAIIDAIRNSAEEKGFSLE